MQVKERPRPGWHTGNAAFDTLDTDDATARGPRWQHIRCELYGYHLVDRLPIRCPLRSANPLAAISQLQDEAWREIGLGNARGGDEGAACDLLDRCEVCNGCISSILRYPRIARLRREARAIQ